MTDLQQTVRNTGFSYPDDFLHLFVGGSALHGAKVEGTDDMDIYGVYIEPPEKLLGLDSDEHFVWSTSGQYERNTAKDIDVTLYSLRKYAALAVKGNPTALHFLFAPNEAWRPEFWNKLVPDIKKCVLSKAASSQFIGFVDAQMGRLLGTRGRGKKGQRPELEEKYGYDVKAAMHAVRLLHECYEMLQWGKITFPRPEKEMLIEIRTGKWSLDKVCSEVSEMIAHVERTREHAGVRDNPDRDGLSKIVSNAYLQYWRSHETLRHDANWINLPGRRRQYDLGSYRPD